tara:strand:- start:126 stop:1097 length:972 start_codon:yes stop_codon:yes gene_type:complete
LNKNLQISKMYFLKKLKIYSIILSVILLSIVNSYTIENKILFKVENEIITTIDIYEEIKFLKKFNPEINYLTETELFEISKNSILRSKIKKVEIMNFVKELKVDDRFFLQFIKKKYSKLGIDSLENFESYLKENDLDIKSTKEKFAIELIWNDIIYQKFNKKVMIDREEIKNEILQNPQKERQKELLLSEIVFSENSKIDFEKKYKKILSDIEKIGFKKTALIHSNSETASNGGLIGWIKVENLNQSIRKAVSELQSGQFSKPIRTSSGFIIIKIEEKKEYEAQFNLNEKIEEVVKFKTNDQLNQFSRIYFNKLKKNLIINGL